MIIFSLDGVLADCDHRRHLITDSREIASLNEVRLIGEWQPDYQAYNKACDRDDPILPSLEIFKLLTQDHEVQIWSSRCESVRHKTELWLWDHAGCGFDSTLTYPQILKLRPIGDTTPEHELKEKWLDENIEMINGKRHCKNESCNHYKCGNSIDFVFESDPKSIEMWRRRGVFVFDVNQGDK